MRHSGTIGLLVLLVLSAGAATPARAQEPRDPFAPVIVGSRVRLRAPSALSGRIKGTVIENDGTSLLLSSRDSQPIRVPRAAITQLELSTGRARNTLAGALIGGALYALFTAPLDGEYLAFGVVNGAATGALIGLLVKGDRWSTVPLNDVKVTVAPVRGRGARVALTLRF